MAVFIKLIFLFIVGVAGAFAQMWAIWASRPEVFLLILAVNTAVLFLSGIAAGNWKLLTANMVAQATFGVAAALIGGWQGIVALFITGGLITLATWKSATSAEAL